METMMGNRLNKIYEKAMDNYHGGYIEKALEQCEKGISLNLKDVRLLNLKGMLLYIKGDLKGAIAVWQINSHYNNDEISKIYLNDAKKDEEKLKLYSLAESDIREFKIDDALEKLEKCRVSDFNSINVNNALAICYLRKGNYLRAMEFNEKALNINKEGKTALEIKNQINGYLQDPRDEFKSSMKKRGMIILLILISATAIFNVINIGNKDNKELVSATVSLQTSICPECGRVYVSGGTTHTTIRTKKDSSNPYDNLQQRMNRNLCAGLNFDKSA